MTTLSLFKVFMSPDVIEPVNKVLLSGSLTQGIMVEKFEESLIKFIGNPYLLTLNSATSGLILALRLLMQKDDEWPGFNPEEDTVLTPALTCFATTSASIALNLKIQWLDIDNETVNINLDDLQKKLTSRTKIVVLVHWGGYPVDLKKLKKIQDEYCIKYGFRFKIIEDCAHAFGAEFRTDDDKQDVQKIGNSGNICCFSLQAIKHLTTGDGGIITLPSKELYHRAKLLRWYGIDRDKRNHRGTDFRLENDITESGYKFHMNDLNAVIGLYNLPHIPGLLSKNRQNCKYLRKEITALNNPLIVSLQLFSDDDLSACWLFSLRIMNGKKNSFIQYMKDQGIMVSQVHNRNDINSCVQVFKSDLPNLDQLEQGLVCIPSGWWLSQENLNHILHEISNWLKTQ